MTKNEAREKISQIFSEVSAKEDEIMKKAIAEGKWKMGLDSNNDLFVDVNKEAKAKIKAIIDMIDE